MEEEGLVGVVLVGESVEWGLLVLVVVEGDEGRRRRREKEKELFVDMG
jgi:hypothetical protein